MYVQLPLVRTYDFMMLVDSHPMGLFVLFWVVVAVVKESYNFEVQKNETSLSKNASEDTPLLDYIDGLDDNQREEMASRSSITLTKPSSMQMLPDTIGKSSSSKLADIRLLFIEILKAQYQHKVECGELTDREFVVMALMESLEWATEAVENRNEPLDDWKYVHLIGYPAIGILHRLYDSNHVDTSRRRLDIEKVFTYLDVHLEAKRIVTEELRYDSLLGNLVDTVLSEVDACVSLARDFLEQFSDSEKEVTLSHKFSKILLNQQKNMLQYFVRQGLITEQEANHQMEEVQASLLQLDHCSLVDHAEGQSNPSPSTPESPVKVEDDLVVDT